MNLISTHCKRALTTLLASLALISSSFAQSTVTCKGKVVDAEGLAVIGAYVIEQGSTSNGVTTDLDGAFTLTVPSNATLEVSGIGYVTKQVAPAPVMTITLEEDKLLLEEAVAIGYGSV